MTLIRLTLTSITLVVSLIAVSPAFSEVGTESPPGVADVNIRFPDPLYLSATMSGQIKAVKPGHYQGEARFRIGERVVVRKAIEGKLRTRWSRLRVSLDLDARRKVRREARRTRRRPVLAIQVKYYLNGKKHFGRRAREFIVSSKSCRFCVSVSPLLGDTETVFVMRGWGWYRSRSIDAVYGAYCPPDQPCLAIGLITRFRTDRRGRFVFRFRNGPKPLTDVPEPRASGDGPVKFVQRRPPPGHKRARRTVHLHVRVTPVAP
jgi:hypothetical protein